MSIKKVSVVSLMFMLFSFCFMGGFVAYSEAGIFDSFRRGSKPERNVESFEKEGRYWGEKLRKEGISPRSAVDDSFVNALKDAENVDFFNVHSELKDAFKKGFRLGYEDRTADLVLGPHLTEAAARIGAETSQKFVRVITDFEEGWASTLRNAVEVFIVLISEGSQADREIFIQKFTNVYTEKFDKTQEILKSHKIMTQVSDGGTLLYLDYSKGKTLGALEIPQPDALKKEIYQQTFKVMGDEWGRRYSTNLIKREELIDLLRRCKTALQEVPGNNLGIIYDAFIKSYGTDAENVFVELVKAAGYSETPVRKVLQGPLDGSEEPVKHTPSNRRGKK